jgi:hypothetical protein
MSWFRRTTPLATRMVYGQQAENSCGIASVIMVNYLVKKARLSPYLEADRLSGALDDTYRSERDVDAAYSKVAGFTYNGTQDTNTQLLADVLNELNIGRWRQMRISPGTVGSMISNSCVGPRRVPMILLVNWRSNGHFVVCDAASPSVIGVRADFCDPWDASVHTLTIRRGEPLVYSVQKEAATSAHYYYDQAQTADFSGWIIYCVDTSAVQGLPASHMPVNRAAPGMSSIRPGLLRR